MKKNPSRNNATTGSPALGRKTARRRRENRLLQCQLRGTVDVNCLLSECQQLAGARCEETEKQRFGMRTRGTRAEQKRLRADYIKQFKNTGILIKQHRVH
ncbi:hypothetical protein NDU88_007519 [Pleurodeles waltl]|uniref:Uncharacterized protein n=1 Tax=Pleurodeles waltl TaxID=8319 RepID=A0AAV7QQ39_PLEWA|nr:hypothetical protein NDU88_007519 [Pleurodeles waltl]